jgi:hypothetical protein
MIAVRTNRASPLTITFDGLTIEPLGLCTDIDVSQAVAAQFQNTFDDTIFVTPFGDGPGDINISFIMNPQCFGAGNYRNALDSDDGAVQFYFKNRLLPTRIPAVVTQPIVFRTSPVIVAVGRATFKGYVVGLRIAGRSADFLINVVLSLKAWPV